MSEWIITDINCNQSVRQLGENVFEFKEQRISNPETKEKYWYSAVINLNDYTMEEMLDNITPFGYNKDQLDYWHNSGYKLLIAECIFENLND